MNDVMLPDSLTSIGDLAFSNCYGLTQLELPNSLSIIGLAAFCGCSHLTSISIPSSVTTIRRSAFNGCALTSMYVHWNVPLIIDEVYNPRESFSYPYIETECTLYVPEGTKDKYSTTSIWKDYYAIVEMTTTSAISLRVDESVLFYNPADNTLLLSEYKGAAIITVYDIKGVVRLNSRMQPGETFSVSNLEKGIYIVKAISGDKMISRKIAVK